MHGPSLLEVARQPFAATAYAFLLIEERTRREALLRRLERVRDWQLGSAAEHQPRRLWDEERTVLAELDRPPARATKTDRAELMALAREIDARARAGTPIPVEWS